MFIGGKKELVIYETSDGMVPFEEWLYGLEDRKARAVIRTRLDRLEHGNPGKCESVGGGVSELKIYFGPGYRVYIGVDGDTVILLLCGGDKSSQKRDVQRAHEYWEDYGRRKNK